MNIHEYQAKEILANNNVEVPAGTAAFTVEEAVTIAKEMFANGSSLVVVKAQIHAGGRGKGTVKDENGNVIMQGGVKLAKTVEEVEEYAKNMLGNILETIQTGAEGKKIGRIYVTDGVDIKKEYYLAILLDRQVGKDLIMASSEGGVEIEQVAEESPEKIMKIHVQTGFGVQGFQARDLAFFLGLEGKAFKQFTKFIMNLYKVYEKEDLSMLEINPLITTPDDDIIALDAKVAFDENAEIRHLDWEDLKDLTEEDPIELEAKEASLNYVNLDGNVGCMVNGAGLAMATMDIIKLYGGEPANFLDVGGTADAERVEKAFRIILKDPKVKVILVNIFGGIVRCDRVANGIVDAYKNIGDIPVPIIVRLQGTNAEEAAKIIDESGLEVKSATTLTDAAEKVQAALESVK